MPGVLLVIVRDALTDAKIVGAEVTITSPIRRDMTTDSLGSCQFDAMPASTYTVRVSAEGYSDETGTPTVPAGHQANLDLDLTPLVTIGGRVTCQGSGLAGVALSGIPEGG